MRVFWERIRAMLERKGLCWNAKGYAGTQRVKVQIGQNFLNLTRWFLLTFRSDLNLTRCFLLDSGAFLDPVLSVFPLRNRILGVPKSPKISACGGLKNPNLGRWFLLTFRSDLNLTKVVFL